MIAPKIKGISLVIFASISWGAMPIFTKNLYLSGMTAYMVLTLRYLLAAFSIFIYLIITNGKIKVSSILITETITIGLVGFCGTGLLLYLSYNYISVGLATMLHFIYPTLVTIIMVIFYKEKLNVIKVATVLFSLVGLFFLTCFEVQKINMIGVLLALSSGFTFAYYIVGMNASKLRELSPILMTFYVSLFSGIAMLIIILVRHDYFIHFDLNNVISMIFISVFSTVLSLITFIEGIKIIGSSNGAILNTIEPIVCVILGVMFLAEPISFSGIIGCALIVISLLINNMQTDKPMK